MLQEGSYEGGLWRQSYGELEILIETKQSLKKMGFSIYKLLKLYPVLRNIYTPHHNRREPLEPHPHSLEE